MVEQQHTNTTDWALSEADRGSECSSLISEARVRNLGVHCNVCAAEAAGALCKAMKATRTQSAENVDTDNPQTSRGICDG